MLNFHIYISKNDIYLYIYVSKNEIAEFGAFLFRILFQWYNLRQKSALL